MDQCHVELEVSFDDVVLRDVRWVDLLLLIAEVVVVEVFDCLGGLPLRRPPPGGTPPVGLPLGPPLFHWVHCLLDYWDHLLLTQCSGCWILKVDLRAGSWTLLLRVSIVAGRPLHSMTYSSMFLVVEAAVGWMEPALDLGVDRSKVVLLLRVGLLLASKLRLCWNCMLLKETLLHVAVDEQFCHQCIERN